MSRRPSATPAGDLRHFERQARNCGFLKVAGIDEGGRGPLAGPVVAAAVMLPESLDLPGVFDSKQLTARQREECNERILALVSGVAIGQVEASEIDRINILAATFEAMMRAVNGLCQAPDYLLIDGPYRLPLDIHQEGIRGGDRRSLSIAAASIVAKVHRDRLMEEYHRRFPEYGFKQHKGYPTRDHLEALRRLGPCPIHRRSFAGVLAPQPGQGEGDGDPSRERAQGRKHRP